MIRLRLAYIIPLAALALGSGLMAAPASAATSGTWTVTGSMNTARYRTTANVLPDGEVLVIGGGVSDTSAELYNPATGTWSPTGSMGTPRESQTATLLANGDVLVAGGLTSTAEPVASAELYNPATGKWAPTGTMSVARQFGNATLLPDGDVLATAGIEGETGPFAELYNPAAGRWSPAIGNGSVPLGCAPAQNCRTFSSATLLGDGDVLVAGGWLGTASNPGTTTSALLYNPANGTWATTGSLNAAHSNQTASLLPDGQVLVAGGEAFGSHRATILASAELYTP